ncbi:tRNA (N(6)-L-threonylcarbamoyladenosine(37)-C(2))-methylthiotransferase MtaB [Bacillota bacterium]
MSGDKLRIAFYTLGCKVNQYETQALKEGFAKRGFTVVDDYEKADVYVINTCTVTNLADRKSRQYIRRMKRLNIHSIIAVIGCYAQVSPEEAAAISGVDLVLGNNEKNSLPDYIERLIRDRQRESKTDDNTEKNRKDYVKSPFVRILKREELAEYEESGIITTMESRTRAYIKIQDGCDQFCSYCIIPYARGPVRSRPAPEIIKEAESLIERGFKELILTGINTALYGQESGAEKNCDEIYGIELVVKQISEIPGDFRIRLGSLEPTVIDASLAERLLKYPKLCHHMHLSLQSGSDRILNAMNRNYDREEYLDIVKVLRRADPHYGLTTDVIVGFPGESEDDFHLSECLVKEIGFVKTHVFPYSKRQGTKAAEMPEQIGSLIKKARISALAGTAEESASAFLKGTLGTVRRVLFEECDPVSGLLSGYADNYVRVYCEVPEGRSAESLINTLQDIRFEGQYSDGIKGELR